ncbi:MAG TPA: SpoIIE family protein phosphatase [Acidobacteriaceae bacterium]|jgi:hypothetical protein|nr:SpoIIE family protein phosphatase [Acidobacteriaceae bacterium]
MRRFGLACTLFFSIPFLCLQAQSARSNTNPAGAQANAPITVKLGDSSTVLAGPWKFHTGDDPAWSRADFDDSAWNTMDLAPGVGWTRQGYPRYSGFAWYRLRVEVHGATHQLALKMPDQADDAYQVFVNGEMIGEFGRFDSQHVTAYPALPEGFPLPKTGGDGTLTIAIRMWMNSGTPFSSPDAGGLHGPPTLGYAALVRKLIQLDYDAMAHYFGSAFVEGLILLMAMLMAIALAYLDPHEEAYPWLALVCLVTLLGLTIVLSVNYTTWLSLTQVVVLSEVALTHLRIGLWVLFWGYWFRVSNIRQLHWGVWSLVALMMAGTALIRPPLYGEIVPLQVATYVYPLLMIGKLALGVLLLLVAYRGFRTQKTEGWMAATAVLLVFVANYQRELRQLHIPIAFSILGFSVQLGLIAMVVSLLIITVMLLRRFIQAQALKEQWKLEIQQAQHVQQVLIPNELPQVEGLTIESEYRPAREVGGDFFQIIPIGSNGSVLIVLGDVTGKGLQAGMLVALIVGAVRAAAQHSSDPLQILQEVNTQLCERQSASATGLIMRIDADGTVSIANAGQLPPYHNGVEVEMEGALPLGIVPEAEFASVTLEAQPGDSLMLMSDGIVEAQDDEGNLFGFDRIREMLDRRATASEIADAAQAFGQEDDILVLQVRRNGFTYSDRSLESLSAEVPA